MNGLSKELKAAIETKFSGRVWCYCAIGTSAFWRLAIVVGDEPGYQPIENVFWSDNEADARTYATRLNAERHIPESQAMTIVASSMGAQRHFRS